jgi:Protein of unknown function (DUF4242)
VPQFLVEVYVSRADAKAVDACGHRARAAADVARRNGVPIQYLRSILVPEDETCFLLYEAPAAEQVERTLRLASLQFERISVSLDA